MGGPLHRVGDSDSELDAFESVLELCLYCFEVFLEEFLAIDGKYPVVLEEVIPILEPDLLLVVWVHQPFNLILLNFLQLNPEVLVYEQGEHMNEHIPVHYTVLLEGIHPELRSWVSLRTTRC